VDIVVLDKTGTVTEGRPAVTDIVSVNGFTETEILRLAAAVERSSEHPLADAVVEAARMRKVEFTEAEAFSSITGRGVQGTIGGRVVLAGTARLLTEKGVDVAPLDPERARLSDAGRTVVLVAVDGAAAGMLAITDPIKESSRSALASLREMGLDLVLLTGDNEQTGTAIAEAVGIQRVVANVLP
jgi:Cu+-exporting ATPase